MDLLSLSATAEWVRVEVVMSGVKGSSWEEEEEGRLEKGESWDAEIEGARGECWCDREEAREDRDKGREFVGADGVR